MSSFSTYSTYNRYNHVLETPLTIDTRPILETPFSTSLNEMSYPQNSRHNSRESYYSNSSFGSTASSPTSVSALGHKNTSTLFVGDLSFLANEERLRELFSAYGRVDSIHLKKSDINHHRNHLSYGFVKFSCPEAAVLAYQACQGKMFLGRNLRLGFADDYHPSAHHHQPFTPSRQHTGNGMTTAQLYVTFASGNLFLPISELSLREVFAQFGPLSDVTIKQIETNQEVGIQSGYGFVHYPLTEEGIRAAMLATEKVHNAMINRVRFQCRFSHGLKKYLANMPPSFFQRPSPPFPPTVPTQQTVSESQYHHFGSTIGLPVAKTVAGRISPSDEAKESHYFTYVNPQHGNLPTYTTTTTATLNEERLSLSSLYL